MGRSSSVIESEAWLGGIMELAAGFETVRERPPRGRPFVAAGGPRRRARRARVPALAHEPAARLPADYRLAPLAAIARWWWRRSTSTRARAREGDLDDVSVLGAHERRGPRDLRAAAARARLAAAPGGATRRARTACTPSSGMVAARYLREVGR